MSKYNLPRKRCQIKFIGKQHELYTVTVINVASQGNLAGVEPAKLSRDTGTEARGYNCNTAAITKTVKLSRQQGDFYFQRNIVSITFNQQSLPFWCISAAFPF